MLALAAQTRKISRRQPKQQYKRKTALNKHYVAFVLWSKLLRRSIFLVLFAVLPSLAHAIDAPRDTRGTIVRADVIKWEWNGSSGATRYQVSVNGAYVSMTKNKYYYSRNLKNGDYTFTVKAVDGNGRYSSPSKRSAVRTIGRGSANKSTASNSSSKSSSGGTSSLPAPRDPRGTLVRPGEIKWEWARVSGAEQYEVFVDNNPVGLTTDLFVYTPNLSSGQHSMIVRSVDKNGGRSADSARATQSVNGGSNTSKIATSSSNGSNGLPAPRDPRGTRVRPAEVKWEWAGVSGASEYEITVNDTSYRASSLYLYTKNLPAGEHTMTVRALTKDGKKSPASNVAKESTSANTGGSGGNSQSASNASVSGPTDVRGTQVGDQDGKWEWRAVPGATSYKVYLDGSSAGVTKDDFFYTPNLSGGSHSVAVTAFDSDGRESAKSGTAKLNITGNFAQNGNGTAPPPPADDNGLIDPASWDYREVSQKSGYKLVFSDEFNNNALNPNRWNTQLRWDGSHNGDRYEYRLINGESQFYVNTFSKDQAHLDKVASVYNPFQFDGNRLAIRAIANPLKDKNTNNAYGPLDSIYRQQPFLSGAISTYDKFSQKYGYFEARIKIPAHVGTFPAFWLHHQRRESENTQKTEIDILENLGHNPHYVYNAAHYFTGVSEKNGGKAHSIKPSPQGQIHTGTIYSDDYHVYAVEWKPGHIRYLIDGQQVSEVKNKAFNHEELYVIMNLAVGGIWTNMRSNAGGTGRSADNRFPTRRDINEWKNPALEIDWVRVYKKR